MSDDWVIKVEHVSKKFTRSLKRSMAYGLIDTTKSMVGLNIHEEKLREGEFWALQDINFELKKGESLGLIGRNGCGKSTLLRLINGIYPPSTGKISIKGRMGALIAVGAGFHPHMSGRENIYLNGTILGMSRAEINQKMDKIIEFAEIGDFIDAPVATYSSGMTVRLGFSIAVHADIDILLADEVLAVGDMKFVAKCFNKLGQLRDQGVSIILVTHDTQSIISFCDQAILLDKGVTRSSGKTPHVVNKYFEYTGALLSAPVDDGNNHREDKTKAIVAIAEGFEISEVIHSPAPNGEGKIEIEYGSSITSNFYYNSDSDIGEVEFHVALSIEIPGPRFYITCNKGNNQPIIIKRGEGVMSVTVESLNINNIEAALTFSLWRKGMKECLYWSGVTEVIAKKVEGSRGFIHYPVSYNHSQL